MSDLTIPLKVVDNGDGTHSITSVIKKDRECKILYPFIHKIQLYKLN
jgi:hypothetical protein